MFDQSAKLPMGLLEAAPDAMIGVTPDGMIVLANARVEELFGYPRSELIGRPVEILVPDVAQAVHPKHRLRYGVDPVPRPMGAGMELAARRKDGTEFPAEISLSPVDTEDGLIIAAAIRDVTERREFEAERERHRASDAREQLENRLHQSQRLESLGQLAGGVAHDFNNLLSVILNYASFVEEEISAVRGVDQGRWDAAYQDVQQIRRAAERATALTHQLLTFGRREVVRPQVLSLNAVVIGVEQLLRRTIDEQVELITELTPNPWPVLADPGQLEQVLVNLAINARDAMQGGGVLRITTSNVIVDEADAADHPGLAPGRFARLRLSDTGTGMSSEVVDRAFEPFFTTKPKGEGSGLGLATVYGIITGAEGFARISSEAGVGTIFSALLPVTDRTAAGPAPVPAPTKTSGGETVLVVEDEEAMREVTRRVLTRKGYRVLTAASGPAALELLARNDDRIDLLLTDVIMPQMLGKDVADRVTALRPEVRVLYMSGYAEPVLTSQGTLLPGVSLIEKPFSQLALLKVVRDVLDA